MRISVVMLRNVGIVCKNYGECAIQDSGRRENLGRPQLLLQGKRTSTYAVNIRRPNQTRRLFSCSGPYFNGFSDRSIKGTGDLFAVIMSTL